MLKFEKVVIFVVDYDMISKIEKGIDIVNDKNNMDFKDFIIDIVSGDCDENDYWFKSDIDNGMKIINESVNNFSELIDEDEYEEKVKLFEEKKNEFIEFVKNKKGNFYYFGEEYDNLMFVEK